MAAFLFSQGAKVGPCLTPPLHRPLPIIPQRDKGRTCGGFDVRRVEERGDVRALAEGVRKVDQALVGLLTCRRRRGKLLQAGSCRGALGHRLKASPRSLDLLGDLLVRGRQLALRRGLEEQGALGELGRG